jgi:hypothetical protein
MDSREQVHTFLGGGNIILLYLFNQCLFTVFLINTLPYIISYLFIYDIHYDMFQLVIMAISGQCYNITKGKN